MLPHEAFFVVRKSFDARKVSFSECKIVHYNGVFLCNINSSLKSCRLYGKCYIESGPIS